MVVFWAVIGAVVWACLASFACVVGERVPRKESINGRSHCVCGRELKPWENIPILGWVRKGGVSTCCNQKIPTRFVVLESVAAIAGALAGAGVGVVFVQVGTFAAVGALVLSSVCACAVMIWLSWQPADQNTTQS